MSTFNASATTPEQCACDSGAEGNAAADNGECKRCAAGSYKPSPGNTECSPCPPGSASVEGATSSTQCSCKAANSAMGDAALACACEPGFGGDAAAAGGGAEESRCAACAVGWFKSELSNQPCIPCPAGPGGVLRFSGRPEIAPRTAISGNRVCRRDFPRFRAAAREVGDRGAPSTVGFRTDDGTGRPDFDWSTGPRQAPPRRPRAPSSPAALEPRQAPPRRPRRPRRPPRWRHAAPYVHHHQKRGSRWGRV